MPKRLGGIFANRPQAVTALSRIFLEEIEQRLCHAADVPTDREAAGQACPRLGAVSFQHRFGSAVNEHVHLHACATDGQQEQASYEPELRKRKKARVASAAGSQFLTHLGEPLDPPRVSPARGPPVDWGELVQSHGDGEFVQASPDDLPMIDIHHRYLPVPFLRDA